MTALGHLPSRDRKWCDDREELIPYMQATDGGAYGTGLAFVLFVLAVNQVAAHSVARTVLEDTSSSAVVRTTVTDRVQKL